MKSSLFFKCPRSHVSNAAIATISTLLPALVLAVCTCGFDDGRFTLVPITVNGNMNDWAPVHADLDNNVCDGPANSLADRDAPVQSTGRDLTHFAYTYDNTNVYLFTERFGSASNTQTFVYYADVDFDGLMETGETVIGVTWQGSNRRINVYVFTYVSQAPGGDPMVDTNGFGDGYTLPGTFANVPSGGNPTRTGGWGSANGLQMEFYVTWAELGLAPNSPFNFHVSSSNASLGSSGFAAQVDDNLAGCGGGPGTMAQTGVTFTPDRTLTGIVGQAVVGVHNLTNTGNATDSFDFSESVSGDLIPGVTYYEDTDASGTLTPGDILLTDTDGDSFPNTALLPPGASITVLIVYNIPPGTAGGDSATVVSTASSDLQPLSRATVTDTISAVAAPVLEVTKDLVTVSDPVNLTTNPKAIPGAVIEYLVTVKNSGDGVVDADTFQISDRIPDNSCLIVDDIAGIGSGPVLFEDGTPSSNLGYSFVSLASTTDDLSFSNDNGLAYSYMPTANADGCDPAVTDFIINPTGEFASDTGSGQPSAAFSFRVLVN